MWPLVSPLDTSFAPPQIQANVCKGNVKYQKMNLFRFLLFRFLLLTSGH